MESSRAAGFDGTEVDRGKCSTLCVPDLVQRHAITTPDALAVRAASNRLTYRELNSRSNQLANYLQTLGVIPGSVVGLCVERTLDFPVAALAILKAGGAYLPLDTKTPKRRLQMMLDAAQVPVVLTNSSMQGSLAGDGRKLVALDHCTTEISRSSSEAPSVRLTPEQLAYVIYTSGSTGTAKAVVIGHGSLLNLIKWHNRTFGVTAAD